MVGDSAYQEILKTPKLDLRAAQLQQIDDFKMKIQSPLTVAEEADTAGERFAKVTTEGKGGFRRTS